jgi:hypothetical protein
MQAWLGFVTRQRLLEIALAVALGIAAYEAVRTLSSVVVTALAQHVGRTGDGDPRIEDLFYGQYYLYFNIADIYVVYGQVLVAVLALGLIAAVGLWIVRRRDHELGACPFCASRIPYQSTHCAYCGSAVAPGEP